MEMQWKTEKVKEDKPVGRRDNDWAGVWYDRMMSRQGMAPDCCSLWPEKEHAQHYWETVQAAGKKRMEAVVEDLPVENTSRVLDIGAGPGTLAIPLTNRVSHITAVEPSSGMMDVLLENAFACGASNITCVPKMWEEVDAKTDLSPPYDVVIASFSLEMPRIDTAVRKMIEVCSGWVYLFWFAEEPTWTSHYKSLWPELHGRKYPPTPKLDILLGVLWQMGVSPQVEITPATYPMGFSSIREALNHVAPEYNVQTSRQERILLGSLKDSLVRRNGSLVLEHSFLSSKVCWKVDSHRSPFQIQKNTI
jgi:SAM-dependent methyltransferase